MTMAPMTMTPQAMKPVAITAATAASALGIGRKAQLDALKQGRSGLSPEPWETVTLPTWIGRVDEVESHTLPADLVAHDCRNNRLAHMALVADDFPTRVSGHASAGAHTVWACSWAPAPRASCKPNWLTARAIRPPAHFPLGFHYAQTHNTFSVADYVRHALAAARPGLRGVHRVFVGRQGVWQRAPG